MATDYVFVIRIWQAPPAPPNKPAPWRVLVEDPRSGQRWGFGDMPALFDFLQHIAADKPANEGAGHAPRVFTNL